MNDSPTLIRQAYKDGKINKQEAEYYLKAVHNTTLNPGKTHKQVVIALFLVLGVGLATLLMFSGGGLTGLLVYDSPVIGQKLLNASIEINQTTTNVSISGILYGEGTATVRFVTDTTTYIVAQLSANSGKPRTAKGSYLPGEQVTLENIEGQATYYLDDGTDTTVISVPFTAPAEGEYEILIIQDTGELSTTRIPLVVSTTSRERETPFALVCEETCNIPPTTGNLEITVRNAELELTAILITPTAPNSPPQLKVSIPQQYVTGEQALDMAPYFLDVDQDELFFSTSNSDLATLTVEDSMLTITPLQDGEDEITIYVSDLEELIEATFTLVVEIDNSSVEGVNESTVPNTSNVDISSNVTNDSIESNSNTTSSNDSERIPPGQNKDACAHPNPNQRPVSCLQEQGDEYFVSENIYWEDNNRARVGVFNQIGNLLIAGDYIEYSTDSPNSANFKLGNVDRDGNIDSVLWIDDEGNLHLTGRLFEETATMLPPPGSYSVLTKRSIYLAYLDMTTGDLYIRGNVIPYRRELQ